MMEFDVKYVRDGVIRERFTVPACEAYLIGVYRDGIPYQPDREAIYNKLPYHYRKAFYRSNMWKGVNGDGNDVFRADMWNAKHNKPLGTVFAKAVERAE